MAEKFSYRSVLAPYLQRLIALKESAGHAVIYLKWVLKEFDDFAVSKGLKEPNITYGFIEAWRKTRIADADKTLFFKYWAWNQLTKMMCRNGVPCFVPPLPRQPNNDFEPYIFSEEEIDRIFKEADSLILEHRRMYSALISMPAILRTIYAEGLRVEEALSIKNEDVHLEEGYIVIRKTKNKVERIVALKESMKAVLKQFIKYRNQLPINDIDNPKSHLFVKCDGTPIGRGTVYNFFKRILEKCGIPHMGNHHGPRIHDLRHTYAVHSLAKIARSGQDVYTLLPALSVSLGHVSLASTERYVRLTQALFPDVSEKCSELNKYIFPKLNTKYDDYSN